MDVVRLNMSRHSPRKIIRAIETLNRKIVHPMPPAAAPGKTGDLATELELKTA